MIHNKKDYIAFLKDKYVGRWIVDAKGIHTAGWGLTLTPTDMSKIGQLFLNNGLWDGKQILSSKWVHDSIKEQSRWENLSYGYLWWLIDTDGHYNYAALGDGGNIIYVSPSEHLVVAITAQFKPRCKDSIEFIQKYLLPSLACSV